MGKEITCRKVNFLYWERKMATWFNPPLPGDQKQCYTLFDLLKNEGLKALENKNFFLANVIAGSLDAASKQLHILVHKAKYDETQRMMEYFRHECNAEHHRVAAAEIARIFHNE